MGTFDAHLATFLQWLLKATLQGSLLVCLILLVKVILRDRLPARWHYCLWLVLLMRLALPWAPPSRISIYGLIPRSFSSYDAASGLAVPPPNEARARPDAIVRGSSAARMSAADRTGTAQPGQGGTAEPSAMQPPLETPASANELSSQASGQDRRFASVVARVLAWVWLAGTAALAGYILIRAFGLWRAVAFERPVTDQQVLDLLEDCKMQMRVRTLVGVVVTDKVQTPALFGVIRPRILLPQGLIGTFGLDELHCVFLHELAHLKRRDICLAWLVCLLQVLHWFNPLIWFAFRRMRADQEMAADALALTTAGAEESRRYGHTIVSLVERFSRPQYLPSLAGILENPSHIERRIHMIAQFNRTPRRPLLATAILAVLGLIALTDAQNRPEGAKPASVTPQANSAGAIEKTPLAGESNVFVDPKAGIRFRKVKAFVGPDDVIGFFQREYLQVSPNGKFLLDRHSLTAIPLDGGKSVSLFDLSSRHAWWAYGATEGFWSPDGKKVVFHLVQSGTARVREIWVVHVDPDTAQPTGPAKKLAEGQWWVRRWLPDSERIMVARDDKPAGGWTDWIVSISDGALTQITDVSSVGTLSPDGNDIAYSEDLLGNGPIWVKSTKGGPARKIADDRGYPDGWSADSKWIYSRMVGGFIRITDGYKVDFGSLAQANKILGGPLWLPQPSVDVKKMYFFRVSEDYMPVVKVVSVVGGSPCELGIGMSLESAKHFWCPDSQAIIVGGRRMGNDANLWALPLDGGEPIPFKTDVPVGGGDHLFSFSPDRKSLLVTAYKADDPDTGRVLHDVSVVPVSWQEMRTTGPAVLIFKKWHCGDFLDRTYGNVWSPDGKKVALADLGSIYIVPATGRDAVQLLKAPNAIDWLNWSPDGKMIAFHQSSTDAIEVVSSSGGEARVVFHGPQRFDIRGDFCWSPDSKAIIIAARGDGVIRSVSIADGSTRSLVNLKDLDVDWVVGLQFSPDARLLAFGDPDEPLFLLHMESAKVDKLPGEPDRLCWSPDGKWLSYYHPQYVKVRSESVLWEMDVEEALAKLAK